MRYFVQEEQMRITYDEKADALYIAFGEGPATVEEVVEGIALDWNAEGKLLGIEILDVSKRVANPEVFKQWSKKVGVSETQLPREGQREAKGT
jgi:uncharacterized protein YuzE